MAPPRRCHNPLEDNFRVSKVVNGKQTQFRSADVAGDAKRHTLRVPLEGRHITCYLVGKKNLEADDATFPEAGRIGRWSKVDAQSFFNDLLLAVE